MPVKVGKNGKPFNPSLGHAFSNDKFGKGSVLLRIDAENLKTISENLQVGSTILLRYNKVAANGSNHYFTEILPAQAKTSAPRSAKIVGASDLD